MIWKKGFSQLDLMLNWTSLWGRFLLRFIFSWALIVWLFLAWKLDYITLVKYIKKCKPLRNGSRTLKSNRGPIDKETNRIARCEVEWPCEALTSSNRRNEKQKMFQAYSTIEVYPINVEKNVSNCSKQNEHVLNKIKEKPFERWSTFEKL